MKFRKKPVVIDAIQWSGRNPVEIEKFFGADTDKLLFADVHRATIVTLEGYIHANPGDWIIKGVKGEFYPCKPDIFEATYEAVNPQPE